MQLNILDVIPFREHLTELQAEALQQTTEVRKYKKGEWVHHGNCDCVGILYVCSGVLRVYMLSPEGKEVTLFRLKQGDFCVLSASCILKVVHFETFLDAETDAELLQMDTGTFKHLMEENVYVENFVYRTAAGRFSDVMQVMEQMLFQPMDVRLARYLLEQGPVVRKTQSQIAQDLGTAREVVSRLLKEFAVRSEVELARGSVTVTDPASLRAML